MDVTPMHVAFEEVKKDAEDLSIAVTGSELVCGYFIFAPTGAIGDTMSVCVFERERVCVLNPILPGIVPIGTQKNICL